MFLPRTRCPQLKGDCYPFCASPSLTSLRCAFLLMPRDDFSGYSYLSNSTLSVYLISKLACRPHEARCEGGDTRAGGSTRDALPDTEGVTAEYVHFLP